MTSKSTPKDSEIAAPEVASSESKPEAGSSVRTNLQTANLIEGYHVIAEWIRFADAKAAVVLTVGGAVGGLVVPTLKGYLAEDATIHPTAWWTTMVVVCFSLWLLLLLLSGIWAFLCILPFRKKGRHPALDLCSHFHPAAISAAYTIDSGRKFQNDCEQLGEDGLRREVSACLLIDSHISSVKYKRVSTSIRLMGASAIIALVYLVLIQF